MFIGFVWFVSITSGMVTSRMAAGTASGAGNIGIVEIEGVILSSKKAIREIQEFEKNSDIPIVLKEIFSK